MSCSARIPIYLLLAGTFFAANAGSVMLGLYVLGIVLAVVTARLMRRFLFPVDETPFVMELPPYRLPTWKTTLTHMWDKCAQYLKKMGGMILIASVVVWFLSYYPRTEESAGTEAHYENSYLGRLGKGCEPVFSPLGFNWKASVALLSGLPAKEIVVSTLGVLYSEGAATTPAGTEIIGGADGRPKSSSRNLSRKSSPNPPGRRKRPHCRSGCWRAAISRPPRRWHSSSSSCSTSPASPRWWPSEPKPGGNGPRHRSFTTRRWRGSWRGLSTVSL